MQEKTIKRYYIIAGILFALAAIIGIIRIFDIILQSKSLHFLDIYAIILLVLSLSVFIVMIVHASIVEKKQKKDALLRANDPDKLKKYASKKSK